jgi:hypothetical protein
MSFSTPRNEAFRSGFINNGSVASPGRMGFAHQHWSTWVTLSFSTLYSNSWVVVIVLDVNGRTTALNLIASIAPIRIATSAAAPTAIPAMAPTLNWPPTSDALGISQLDLS